jgi:hypothetical protein
MLRILYIIIILVLETGVEARVSEMLTLRRIQTCKLIIIRVRTQLLSVSYLGYLKRHAE